MVHADFEYSAGKDNKIGNGADEIASGNPKRETIWGSQWNWVWWRGKNGCRCLGQHEIIFV